MLLDIVTHGPKADARASGCINLPATRLDERLNDETPTRRLQVGFRIEALLGQLNRRCEGGGSNTGNSALSSAFSRGQGHGSLDSVYRAA